MIMVCFPFYIYKVQESLVSDCIVNPRYVLMAIKAGQMDVIHACANVSTMT